MIDILWFKKELAPKLKNFEIKYRHYTNGQFGNLNQVEFNSAQKGGEIDFWDSGWLNIHLVDFEREKVLINILIKPEQKAEKVQALKDLQFFLK